MLRKAMPAPEGPFLFFDHRGKGFSAQALSHAWKLAAEGLQLNESRWETSHSARPLGARH